MFDLTNQRFGRLVAVLRAPNKAGNTAWHCTCDCGGDMVIRTAHELRSGDTKSCGCLRREATIKRNQARQTHGHSVGRKVTPTWESWHQARQRCFNPKNKRYSEWGGRGITMCEAWRESFETFLADMGECPLGFSIERVDNNGNYEPGNCRWATPKEQANNRRNNVLVEYEGRQMTLAECAAAAGVSYKNLHRKHRVHKLPLNLALEELGAFK